MSLFGAKVLGLLMLWQEAAASPAGEAATNQCTLTEMVHNMGGDEIEAYKRALRRAIAIKPAEFKRGLSGLATIGSTAPFVGLFGTVFGIINAFRGMKNAESAGIAAVAGGISEALFTTALGLLVAVPAV